MSRIIDFINNFIQPKPEDKTFDELAIDAGMSEKDIKTLKQSMEGVSWAKFAREDEGEDEGEENKKKVRKFSTGRIQTKPEVSKESSRKEGIDRE